MKRDDRTLLLADKTIILEGEGFYTPQRELFRQNQEQIDPEILRTGNPSRKKSVYGLYGRSGRRPLTENRMINTDPEIYIFFFKI